MMRCDFFNFFFFPSIYGLWRPFCPSITQPSEDPHFKLPFCVVSRCCGSGIGPMVISTHPPNAGHPGFAVGVFLIPCRERSQGVQVAWLEQRWMPCQVLCTRPEHPFLTSPLAAACWKDTWASVAWGEASPGAFWLPLGPHEPARSPSPSWWGSQAIGLHLGRGVCVQSYFYLCVFRKFFVATVAGCVLGNGVGRGTGQGGGNVAKTGLFSARAIFLFLCCSRA